MFQIKYYHNTIYYFGLCLLAASLPLSMFLLSVAQIVLLVNWVLEGKFEKKFILNDKIKSIVPFLIIYGIHIIGMFYSSDLIYGLHDLRIKLPLLVLPIIIGTSNSLNIKQISTIILCFIAAVLVSTIISTGYLFSWWGKPVTDIRDISVFISHIRLALMINIAIFSLFWLLFQPYISKGRIILILILIWLVLFLFMLKSLTGIIIFFICCTFFSLKWVYMHKIMLVRWVVVVGALTLLLLAASYFSASIAQFYTIEKIDLSSLDKATINGNLYNHNLASRDFENGNYTWLYVCDKELQSTWTKRSKILFDKTDIKGQELRYTLIRYLTSKGLRKDSIGVMTLTDQDIKNIELGMANYIYSWKFSLYPRIYQLLWEVNQYQQGSNPSGHSFTQRLEYFRTACHIIQNHFWLGVGTGDVSMAFHNQYQNDHSKLIPRWQLRAHNQFITFFLTFGIFGFIIIGIALFYPIFREKKWNDYFMLLFLFTGFVSFLNEDTLETHAGVSFFAFFYSLFLFGFQSKELVMIQGDQQQEVNKDIEVLITKGNASDLN
jgi:hypothetical protein